MTAYLQKRTIKGTSLSLINSTLGQTMTSILEPDRARGTVKPFSAESLLPVALNEPVSVQLIAGLEAAVATAVYEANRPRPRQAIPTADYITTSSFKVNSKLVIRVEPSTGNTKNPSHVSNRISRHEALHFDRFSLQGVAESDEERYQLHETFEGEVLFLFGRRPRIWTFTGMVMNGRMAPEAPGPERPEEEARRLAKNMDFCNDLLRKYEDFYRGSKAVELRARTYIAYEDVLIEGTLVSLIAARNAQIPGAVNVTFTVVIHERSFFGQQDEVSEASVAALIKQQGLFQEKIDPAGLLPPPPSTPQLVAQARGFQERARELQERSAEIQGRREATARSLSEAEARIEEAAAALAAAERDLNSAGSQGQTAEAQERRDAAKAAMAEARADLSKAQSDKQALNSQLSDTAVEVQDVANEQADTALAADVVTDIAERSSGLRTVGGVDISGDYESGQVNITVTYTASSPPSARVTVRTVGGWIVPALSSTGRGDGEFYGDDALDQVFSEYGILIDEETALDDFSSMHTVPGLVSTT